MPLAFLGIKRKSTSCQVFTIPALLRYSVLGHKSFSGSYGSLVTFTMSDHRHDSTEGNGAGENSEGDRSPRVGRGASRVRGAALGRRNILETAVDASDQVVIALARAQSLSSGGFINAAQLPCDNASQDESHPLALSSTQPAPPSANATGTPHLALPSSEPAHAHVIDATQDLGGGNIGSDSVQAGALPTTSQTQALHDVR